MASPVWINNRANIMKNKGSRCSGDTHTEIRDRLKLHPLYQDWPHSVTFRSTIKLYSVIKAAIMSVFYYIVTHYLFIVQLLTVGYQNNKKSLRKIWLQIKPEELFVFVWTLDKKKNKEKAQIHHRNLSPSSLSSLQTPSCISRYLISSFSLSCSTPPTCSTVEAHYFIQPPHPHTHFFLLLCISLSILKPCSSHRHRLELTDSCVHSVVYLDDSFEHHSLTGGGGGWKGHSCVARRWWNSISIIPLQCILLQH